MDKDRIKILYLITKANWGGAQRYVYDLATHLPSAVFEPVVASGPGVLIEKLKQAGVRTHVIERLGRDIGLTREFSAFFKLLNVLKRERPDILHLNSSKAGGLGALAGRIAGVPVILFTAHGWAFNEERPYYQILLIKFFSAITLLLCHQVIAVSEFDKQTGLRLPFSQHKLITIYNGIAAPKFKEKKQARIELLPGASRLPIFWAGTVGELHNNKGLDRAIHAVAALKRQGILVTYVIIGEGEERRTLEALITKEKVADLVHLVGHRHDAASYLQAFDVLILPDRKVGLSYVLLEAGFASLPVVATNVGSMAEVIQNGISGLLVSPDSMKLASALLQLIEDPNRSTYGAMLRLHAQTQFSLERMLEETQTLYRGLLSLRT